MIECIEKCANEISHFYSTLFIPYYFPLGSMYAQNQKNLTMINTLIKNVLIWNSNNYSVHEIINIIDNILKGPKEFRYRAPKFHYSWMFITLLNKLTNHQDIYLKNYIQQIVKPHLLKDAIPKDTAALTALESIPDNSSSLDCVFYPILKAIILAAMCITPYAIALLLMLYLNSFFPKSTS